MNQREAKRLACELACSVIHSAMAQGWPTVEMRVFFDENDVSRVLFGLDQIVDELHDRSLGSGGIRDSLTTDDPS